MLNNGIKTYKTSVYHPSSNPAERVLRDVGRILRTYCNDNHKSWSEYISTTEVFLNLAYTETLGISPYQMMFRKPPPREITGIIELPEIPEEEMNLSLIHI